MNRSGLRRMLRGGPRLACLSAVSLVSACLCRAGGTSTTVRAASPPTVDTSVAIAFDSAATTVQMRNVDFHLGGDVVMHIADLSGVMRGRGGIVDFDNSSSFVTWVKAANVALDASALANLFNNHVFAYRGAPLRDIRIEIRDGQILQSGILHKGVDIPFKIRADVSLTPEGRIRLHPVDTDIFCVDGDRLMRALGLTMAKMVDVSKAVGVTIEKNDFLIDPMRVLPPPRIRGRLTSVRIVNDRLVQQIAPEPGGEAFAAMPVIPDSTARNYMYYRGGKLHFGRKLLMRDADMLVIDGDPSTPFDFDLERYMAQLTAGYSRTLPSAGLWVLMPDARNPVRLERVVGGEVSARSDSAACKCTASGAGATAAATSKRTKP